jgi:hypothetical protein
MIPTAFDAPTQRVRIAARMIVAVCDLEVYQADSNGRG